MQIRILNTVKSVPSGLTFHAGRVYRASVASNIPGYARLGKKNGVIIKKVFVGKGKMRPDIDTMLIESTDFEVVEMPEKDSIIELYKQSKEKTPRIKKIAPVGFKLRANFRVMSPEEMSNPDFNACMMGVGQNEKCGKFGKYIRENDNKTVTVCCVKHGTVPMNTPV